MKSSNPRAHFRLAIERAKVSTVTTPLNYAAPLQMHSRILLVRCYRSAASIDCSVKKTVLVDGSLAATCPALMCSTVRRVESEVAAALEKLNTREKYINSQFVELVSERVSSAFSLARLHRASFCFPMSAGHLR